MLVSPDVQGVAAVHRVFEAGRGSLLLVWMRMDPRVWLMCTPVLAPCRKDLSSVNRVVRGWRMSIRTRRHRCDDTHGLPLPANIAGSVLATPPLPSAAEFALDFEFASSLIPCTAIG